MSSYFEMVDNRPMRGVIADGPQTELVTVRHELPDGSYMTEVVLRPVLPPEPAPQPKLTATDEPDATSP